MWGPSFVDIAEVRCNTPCSNGVSTVSYGWTAHATFNGTTWESRGAIETDDWVHDVDWADYDGDGDNDMVVSGTCFVRIYRNDGLDEGFLQLHQLFEYSEQRPDCWTTQVSWGDADHDGDVDVAVSGLWGLFVLRNDSDQVTDESDPNTFVREPHLVSDQEVNGMSWGDYNGDGDSDLFATAYGAAARLFASSDDGLTHVSEWAGPTNMYNAVFCHLQAGTRPSVVVVGDIVALYANQGTTLSTSAAWSKSPPAGGMYTDVACGDLDGDGTAEIVVVAREEVEGPELDPGYLRVLSATGDILWTSSEPYNGSGVDLGDINGDGFLDVVLGDDPAGASHDVPEPFQMFLYEQGAMLQLTVTEGADLASYSDIRDVQLVELPQ
jgi:hypothetical protein